MLLSVKRSELQSPGAGLVAEPSPLVSPAVLTEMPNRASR